MEREVRLTMQKLKNSPQDRCYVHKIKSYRQFLYGSILSLLLLVSGFAIVPVLISEASATTTASAAIDWSTVSLSFDPDYDATRGFTPAGAAGYGDINFGSVIPSAAGDNNLGTQKVVKKTLAVQTGGQYYAVYLSMGSSSSNALELTGDTSQTINSINSTWSGVGDYAPKSFSGVSWGYAVPTGNTTAGTYVTPFSAPSVYAVYDTYAADGSNMTYSGLGSDAYNKGTWAGVPTLSAGAQQIWRATTNNVAGFGGTSGDQTKDKFDIYYSVIADTNLVAGVYENTLIYTAIGSVNAADAVSSNISRSLAYGTEGDSETLSFGLASSVPSLATGDVKVYLVPHSVTEANKNANGSYSTAGLSDYKTNAYQCTVNSLTLSSDHDAVLNCTLPVNPDGRTEGGSNMYGEYDFWIHIDTYGYNYISRYLDEDNSEVASFMYAGLQSKKRDGSTPVISKMQEMTTSVCKNTNRWGTGLAASATLYRYDGTTTEGLTGVQASELGRGSFALTDVRDNKTYLVRRFADGNCWMVQNLDLDLAEYAGHNLTNYPQKVLTPENTDLRSSAALARGYYDPQEKLWNNVSGSTLAAKLKETFGFDQVAQFATGTQRNSDVEPQYSWASTKTSTDATSANTVLGTTVYNSSYAAYARSYDNVRFGYVPTDPTTGASTTIVSKNTDGTTLNNHLYKRNGYDGLNDYQDAAWNVAHASQYVGDYYNWYAATAESGTWSQSGGEAEDSICPKGWRLPLNEGNGSWINLLFTTYGQTNSAEGSTNIRKFPLSFAFTGNYEYYGSVTGSLTNRGSYGFWWSATAYSVPNSRYLSILSTDVDPQLFRGKVYGFTVRCVVR